MDRAVLIKINSTEIMRPHSLKTGINWGSTIIQAALTAIVAGSASQNATKVPTSVKV